MSLIRYSLFRDRAKGTFLINASLIAAGWPRLAMIVEPDTSIVASLPAVLLVFLNNSIKP
jgi:hypothetical protein